MSKVMGLDVGDKRIGVAVSDASRLIAAPVETVLRKNMKIDVGRLLDIASREHVTTVVIGLPLNMDGTEGSQALKARSIGKQLQRAGFDVYFEDERLSTFSAVEILVSRGVKTGHNRGLVDMEAAAVILQSFLDKQPRS
jgi:putative Holliday junction resolvase